MDIFETVEIPSWLMWTASLVFLFYIYAVWPYSTFKRIGVKGPKPWPLLGSLPTYFKKGMLEADLEYVRTYGKVVGIYMGRLPELFITDPEMLKQIWVKEFDSFRSRRVIKALNTQPMDQSLLAIAGNRWKRVRNTLSPTFTAGKLRPMNELLNYCVDSFCDNLKKNVAEDQAFEAKAAFSAYTLDVIAITAFGLRVDSQKDPNNPFIDNAKRFSQTQLSNPMIMLSFIFPEVADALLPVFRFFRVGMFPKDCVNFFTKVTNSALEERRENNSNYKDFLQLISHANTEMKTSNGEKGLTDTEVMAQALTFFLAGTDTTSSSLEYLAYHLAVYDDCQEKALKEIDEVLNGEMPNYDNVLKLEYLDQCLNESLRLFPPGFRFDRVAERDITINGVFIPKGMAVTCAAYAMHRDPDIFPEPDKFDPERFSPEQKEKRHPYAFLPFGVGPRNCIGMRLALLEVKILMARVMQKYRFVTCEKTQIPVKLDPMGFLKAERGIWLKVEERKF